MSEPDGGTNASSEKAALEAAFAEVMKAQPQPAAAAAAAAAPSLAQAGQAPERRGRVFSFTGGNSGGSGFSPQVSQGEDGEVSPAFGRNRQQAQQAQQVGGRSFSRGVSGGSVAGLEERIQHIEELLARSNEYHISQLRKQQELEVKISERCGYVVQEVLQSMIPMVVEGLLERMAQCLDFSELRDQLIDAFSASTEMIPVVEERSEVMLALLQEDRVAKNRLSTDFQRVASSIDSLAGWQGPLLERLEALQRAVESMGVAVQRSTSLNGTADRDLAMVYTGSNGTVASRPEEPARKLPMSQAAPRDYRDPNRPRMGSGEGLQGLQAALQRAEQQRSRPPSGHADRAPSARAAIAMRNPVNGRGNDPSWYTSQLAAQMAAQRPPLEGGAASNGKAPRAPSSTSPASDSPANKQTAPASTRSIGRAPSPGRDWPWQPKPPSVDGDEVQADPASTVPPLPTQPTRSRPSDFFTRKSDSAAG